MGLLDSLGQDDVETEDIIFIIANMSCLAFAHTARDKIFEIVGNKEDFNGTETFKKIYLIAKNWNWEYSESCNYVAGKVKNKYLKKTLNRFSNAMSSGEPEESFLENEYMAIKNIYENDYEARISEIKRWTDAYTALLVAIIFISIIVILSMALYGMGNIYSTTFSIAFLTSFVCLTGILLIATKVPPDRVVHSLPHGTKEHEMIKKYTLPSIILAIFSAIVVFLIGAPIGASLLVMGLCLIPVGYLTKVENDYVLNVDDSYAAFLRVLGSTAEQMGASIRVSMGNIDTEALGILEEPVNKLYTRLSSSLDEKESWLKFVEETGSYYVHILTNIFTEATSLGANPKKVGDLLGHLLLRINLLRKKKELVNASFFSVIIPLHIVMIGIQLFIANMMEIFSKTLGSASGSSDVSSAVAGQSGGVAAGAGIQMFNLGALPPDFLSNFVFFLAIILTIANSILLKIVSGGSRYRIVYFAALLFIFTGVELLIIPYATAKLFVSLS